MRAFVTVPLRLIGHGEVGVHTAFLRALMTAGLAKPTATWKPPGPNSWKYPGSSGLMNASMSFVPSSVFVCSHSSPRAMRSAAGVACTSYRPGYMLAMIAWPASGESVAPSDSNFGHVTIMPTSPSVEDGEIGHASSPVAGSIVPASELETG